MRRVLISLSIGLLGLVIGVASSLWTAGLTRWGATFHLTNINIVGWTSDWSIGSSSANAYVRARVARHGLLALEKEEAVYFTRNTDDLGRPLSEACTYRLTGQEQDAYWWSITLYDEESRLPMNSDGALSIDATTIGEAETWTAAIAAVKPEDSASWISSKNAGAFDLTLRIYRPSAAVLESPEVGIKPPSVRRVSCVEEVAS
ncbi:MAG: DUF1214 domain-containing protein [Pseudomonadota bacterium]